MDTLVPILEKLASKIPVDRVFEFEYPFIGIQCKRLLIVADSKSQDPVKTLAPMAELCLAGMPDHSFSIIPYGELKTAINNGSLYYILACQKDQLRLQIGQNPLPILTHKQLETVYSKSKEHYGKAWDKQCDFLEGMKFYLQKENYPQALFMLHQAVELTFRGFENAILKRDRPSHGLHEHLRLIAKHIPEAGYLFPKEEPSIYRLLKLIDQSYTAVRYQRNFEVQFEELDELHRRFLELMKWCNEYYIGCMKALEKLIASAEEPSPEPLIAPDDVPRQPVVKLTDQLSADLDAEEKKALLTILTNLIKREALDHLILLGHETRRTQGVVLFDGGRASPQQPKHCYVLGIGSGGTSKSHTIVHPLIRATVLLCAAHQMDHALTKKNRFFIQTVSQGIALYRHEGAQLPPAPEPDWGLALEKAEAAWKYRRYKADTYWQCAQLAREQRNDIGAATMLVAQSVEQLCIGLIYAAIGYRVDQCNIPFLLNVCNLITPRLADCFVASRDVDRDALKALSNSLNAVRYKREDAPTDTQLAIAMENYERFRSLATQVCVSAFAYLGTKAAGAGNGATGMRPPASTDIPETMSKTPTL